MCHSIFLISELGLCSFNLTKSFCLYRIIYWLRWLPRYRVIQIRKLFGPWHEAGDIKDVLEPELCEYVEAVNLTDDSVIPAGQVSISTSPLSPSVL